MRKIALALGIVILALVAGCSSYISSSTQNLPVGRTIKPYVTRIDTPGNFPALIWECLPDGTGVYGSEGQGAAFALAHDPGCRQPSHVSSVRLSAMVHDPAHNPAAQVACTFGAPNYFFNANITGSNPPPYGYDYWNSTEPTCGNKTNVEARFCAAPHNTSCTTRFSLWAKARNRAYKATGPLIDYLAKMWEQVKPTSGTPFLCKLRVYPTIASHFRCVN